MAEIDCRAPSARTRDERAGDGYTGRMEDHRDERYVEADFSGSRFRGVVLHGVTISDALIEDVDISGHVRSLTVNGIDVAAYVEAELDRRHPERRLLAAQDLPGLREGWDVVQGIAGRTLDRARDLAPELLDERVDGEWSYLETLRHLVCATDRWISGPIFADPEPFHRLGRPNDPVDEWPEGLFDLDAHPTLDEVLAARNDRIERVSSVLRDLDPAGLDREVESPYEGATTVRYCLHVILREEWWHDQYATRDLTVLERLGT